MVRIMMVQFAEIVGYSSLVTCGAVRHVHQRIPPFHSSSGICQQGCDLYHPGALYSQRIERCKRAQADHSCILGGQVFQVGVYE